MTKKIYTVLGMECTNCPMHIEALEDELPGVKKISVSYHKQRAEILFDENKISEAEIIQAVLDIGYTLKPI
jgi:copper chaperone CopZ